MKEMADIAVVGAGVAGLRTASALAKNGASVHLLEASRARAAKTWFVLRSRLPPDVQAFLDTGDNESYHLTGTHFHYFHDGEPVLDYGIDLDGQLEDGAMVMIDQGKLESYLHNQIQQSGVTLSIDRVTGIEPTAQAHLQMTTRSGQLVSAETVIDASGPESAVSRLLIPEPAIADDPLLLWVYGARMRGEFDPRRMIFPLDRQTGKLSWVTPWSDSEADFVASDYCRLSEFKQKLPHFRDMFDKLILLCQKNEICNPQEVLQPIVGKIRVAPIKKPNGPDNLFQIGDAAGQACPNMAEGVTVSLNQADYLATELQRNPDYTSQQYHHDWRYGKAQEYPYDLAATLLVRRYLKDRAGSNLHMYQAILRAPPEQQMRVLRERKMRIEDVPYILMEAGVSPQIILECLSMSAMYVGQRVFTLYDSVLYGERPFKPSLSRTHARGTGR